MGRLKKMCCLALVALACIVLAHSALAADVPSLYVTTATDVVNSEDGKISLREAIAYAEAGLTTNGEHRITFNPSVFASGANTIILVAGAVSVSNADEFTAEHPLIIDGYAYPDRASDIANVVLNGNGKQLVLDVGAGCNVVLANISFWKGTGAISNSGTITIANASFAATTTSPAVVNQAGGKMTFVNTVFSANGSGAIQNSGTINLVNSVVLGDNNGIVNDGTLTGYGVNIVNEADAAKITPTSGSVTRSGEGYAAADVFLTASTFNNAIGKFTFNAKSDTTATDTRGVYVWADATFRNIAWSAFDDAAGANKTAVVGTASSAANIVNFLECMLWSREAAGDPEKGIYIGFGRLGIPDPKGALGVMVTTLKDVDDAYDGKISFREAIANAGKSYSDGIPAYHTVTFDPSLYDEFAAEDFTIYINSMIQTAANATMTIDGQLRHPVTGVTTNITLNGRNTFTDENDTTTSLNNGVRILRVYTYGDVTVKNLTFTKGFAGQACAIEAYGYLHAKNCRFKKCVSNTAGAVWGKQSFDLTGCVFEDCLARTGNGGALTLYTNGTTGDIVDCVFKNCRTIKLNGGAFKDFGTANVVNCSFINCYAYKQGGAIHCSNDKDLRVINCTFTGNDVGNALAETYGRAIYYKSGSPSGNYFAYLANNVFVGNGIGTTTGQGSPMPEGLNNVLYDGLTDDSSRFRGYGVNVVDDQITNKIAVAADGSSIKTSSLKDTFLLDSDGKVVVDSETLLAKQSASTKTCGVYDYLVPVPWQAYTNTAPETGVTTVYYTTDAMREKNLFTMSVNSISNTIKGVWYNSNYISGVFSGDTLTYDGLVYTRNPECDVVSHSYESVAWSKDSNSEKHLISGTDVTKPTLVRNSEDMQIGSTPYAGYSKLFLPYLAFSADDPFGIKLTKHGAPDAVDLEYSTDMDSWTPVSVGTGYDAANNGGKYVIYFRGSNNTALAKAGQYHSFAATEDSTASRIKASGSALSLLDYKTVLGGELPLMEEYAFSRLFKDFTSLTGVPELLATNLTASCYSSMFEGCTALVVNTDEPGEEWSIPSDAVTAGAWNKDMFKGTYGSIADEPDCGPSVGTTYYVVPATKVPTALADVENVTSTVYAGDVVVTDGMVWSNRTGRADSPADPIAAVVYTANEGCVFGNGKTVITNQLDTTKNPVVDANPPVAVWNQRKPDYTQAKDWMLNSTLKPTEAKEIADEPAEDSGVDVFYIYPTIAMTNAFTTVDGFVDIDDPQVRGDEATHTGDVWDTFNAQAKVFADFTHVYVPFYRQVSFEKALEVATAAGMADANQAYADYLYNGVAYADITNALDRYFATWNKGRPFILASHSQGSAMMRNVIEHYFTLPANKGKLDKLVACYAIGYGVTKDWMAQIEKATDGKICLATNATDRGVYVTWNTAGPDSKPYPNLLVPSGAVSVNPLTWTTNTTPAEASLNLGALTNAAASAIVPHLYDATVDAENGVVVCANMPSEKYVGVPAFGDKSLHTEDYQAYWENLRVNAYQRIDTATDRKPRCGTPTDYSDTANWMSYPATAEKGLDVFYLYPTCVPGTCTTLVGEIEDGMKAAANEHYKKGPSTFESYANVYAPYYRQGSMIALISEFTPDGIQRFGSTHIVKTDVFAALDYYFANRNPGATRPFILASHSQGSANMKNVFEEYFVGEKAGYKANLVAAYVLGYKITGDWCEKVGVNFAEGESDTGVILTWNAEGPGTSSDNFLTADPAQLAINPINWTIDNTEAVKAENLGSVITNASGVLTSVKPGVTGARLQAGRAGAVIVDAPETIPVGTSPGFGTKSYHFEDWAFFHDNIGANGFKRYAAFAELARVATNTIPASADATWKVEVVGGEAMVSPVDGELYAPKSATAVKVIYTLDPAKAAEGYRFVNGETTASFAMIYAGKGNVWIATEETKTEIVTETKIGKTTLKLGVVAQRYPWNGIVDVNYKATFWPTGKKGAVEVTVGESVTTNEFDIVGSGTVIGTAAVTMPAETKGKATFKVVEE